MQSGLEVGTVGHTHGSGQILKMDPQRNNIVVSRRAVLEETRTEARSELISNLSEDQILEGVVKNITDYGAFVDLGGVDGLLGRNGLHRLGTGGQGLGLFGAAEDEVRSIALVRMAPHVGPNGAARPALCAFGSPDPEGFTPDMGCELAAFLTRVIERMAERWPILN